MIFHLAIPSYDLPESLLFYESLGAKIGRKYGTSFIMNLFGAQVVCHLSKGKKEEPKMYPRHFGVILDGMEELGIIWNKWYGKECVFQPYFIRYAQKPEEHHTFFLKDPSNNLIEFKWYKDPALIFT